MSDKENIEIFEKIWGVDIINKTEPLYSIAISVAQSWQAEGRGACGKTPLHIILLQRLLNNWENKILDHINVHPMGMPGTANLSELFRSIRDKYKDSPPLLGIVNKIIRNITSDQTPNAGNIIMDPSCVGAH